MSIIAIVHTNITDNYLIEIAEKSQNIRIQFGIFRNIDIGYEIHKNRIYSKWLKESNVHIVKNALQEKAISKDISEPFTNPRIRENQIL